MKKIIFIAMLLATGILMAQETFPRNDVRDSRERAFAFTNATIVLNASETINNGVLLIRDGRIVDVGADVAVPDGFLTVDLNGKTIYPSLIDMHTSYGMPKIDRSGRRGFFSGPEVLEPQTDGAYNANDAIKSHFQASEAFHADDKKANVWRKLGFGAVGTFQADGIARGTGAVVDLRNATDNAVMLNPRAMANFSFRRGTSSMQFPISQMGSIALLRQTHLDAMWYESLEEKPFRDLSLEAWLEQRDLPWVFEVTDWQEVLRADQVGDELGKQLIIKEGGDAYHRLEAIKATGATLVVGVNFPEAPDVEDPLDAYNVNLADMKHWELAPSNPARLEKAGIPFALTVDGLSPRDAGKFLARVRKAMQHGLSEAAALRALTETPARLLGVEADVGSIAKGKYANFIITSGKLFDKGTTLHENWIRGDRYVIKGMQELDPTGMYSLKLGDQSYDLKVTGKATKPKAVIPADGDDKTKVTIKTDGNWVSLRFETDKGSGLIQLAGWMQADGWQGSGTLADGQQVSWRATRTGDAPGDSDQESPKPSEDDEQGEEDEDTEDSSTPADDAVGSVWFPFLPYGYETAPEAKTYLIRNATVWTNGDDGVLAGADVLIRDGKIAAVGQNLDAGGADVIDGTGKHLTAGIIDEHSHLALSSVNDVATNSGMVRMNDVIDSVDVGIYRALAGGVTAAQLLHGSANPIGGQSALVKFRWGKTPEEMKIKDADGFIKFALGENVKRSRSDDSIRYPQTRMGVEQVYRDAFTNARDYQAAWQAYNELSAKQKAKTNPPRRDLVMDTMVEILEGERFVTCHSYVQSEINMLMHVADSFGFNINTFTHILEGYKVADKMAAHGVGGSTFADWWAYKWEVRYAIPYNPILMHDEGVVVAVNSDSSEMIRRLNQEAAKSVKYGGMSEEDALKMVTLNPAKLLHLDDRMGSVEKGKDGDVVLWSDHPLSIYAKAEKTFVDGALYYDIERDAELREMIQAERARLTQKLLQVKKSGAPTGGWPGMPQRPNWDCEDVIDFQGNVLQGEVTFD